MKSAMRTIGLGVWMAGLLLCTGHPAHAADGDAKSPSSRTDTRKLDVLLAADPTWKDPVSLPAGGTITVYSVKGALHQVEVVKLLKRHAKRWSYCAEKDPSATEARYIVVLIRPDGHVQNVDWSDYPESFSPEDCIDSAIQRWKFPQTDAPSRVELEWNPTATAVQQQANDP